MESDLCLVDSQSSKSPDTLPSPKVISGTTIVYYDPQRLGSKEEAERFAAKCLKENSQSEQN
jgi:hypothetical protein